MMELRCFGRITHYSLEFGEELCDASTCPPCSVSIVFMSFLFACLFVFFGGGVGHKKLKWLHLTGSTVELPAELKCQGIY